MKKALFLFAGLLLFLSGCFAMPVEDPVLPPPAVYVPQGRDLRTVQVTRGTVERFNTMTAFHVPSREHRLRFDLDGVRIGGIYVSIGDHVEEGDIIASLYRPDITNRLANVVRQEEVLSLDLSQTRTRHRWALDDATANNVTIDDSGYLAEIARLRHELGILADEIAFLRGEDDARHLRATKSGHITHVLDYDVLVYQGRIYSDNNMTIATITDQTFTVFEIRAPRASDMLHIDEVHDLLVDGTLQGAIVVDPDEFGIVRAGVGDEAYLVLIDETVEVSENPRASLSITSDIVHDVLFIPFRAIQYVGDRVFVYVVNEYGVVSARDIELGLRGNTAYEIISGLEEGEHVVA